MHLVVYDCSDLRPWGKKNCSCSLCASFSYVYFTSFYVLHLGHWNNLRAWSHNLLYGWLFSRNSCVAILIILVSCFYLFLSELLFLLPVTLVFLLFMFSPFFLFMISLVLATPREEKRNPVHKCRWFNLLSCWCEMGILSWSMSRFQESGCMKF